MNFEEVDFELTQEDTLRSLNPLCTLHFEEKKLNQTRLMYNCAHLRSTKESLTILVKILVKIFLSEIFLGEFFLGENFLG